MARRVSLRARRHFLVLLLAATVVGGCLAETPQQVADYMLQADELPPGFTGFAHEPSWEGDGWTNPGRIPDPTSDFAGVLGQHGPLEVWAEFLQDSRFHPTLRNGYWVMAGLWASEANATDAAQDIHASLEDGPPCEGDGGSPDSQKVLLRDRRALVFLSDAGRHSDNDTDPLPLDIQPLVDALKKKQAGLQLVFGRCQD